MRVALLLRSDKDSEAGVPPSQENMAAMGKLLGEMAGAGVLLGAEGLQPSSQGVRIRKSGEKVSVVDGPFVESKELIAGFVLLQVKTIAEAVEWATRFASVQGDFESEIRPLHEASDFK